MTIQPAGPVYRAAPQSKPMNNFGASMNKLINRSVAFDRPCSTGVRLCLQTNRLMDIHRRRVRRESNTVYVCAF